MKNIFRGLIVAAFLAVLCLAHPAALAGAQSPAQITLLDKNNRSIASLVDGNQVALKIELAANVDTQMLVDFLLAGADSPVASCLIPVGKRACQSASFPALGWFWSAEGAPQPQREITARGNSHPLEGSLTVSVLPRPVVMVHGFNSDFHAWDKYLGPQGYLAAIGLHGYAVGDGQVPGVLNTGSLSNPTARTNTIAQNAVILGEYIDHVQSATGAEKVDLLVHSMGGMISRYYLDRVMTDVDVAQLIILGTPMAGSDCARLPASLGILLPATLEIQPSYMVGVFNQQIYRRRGVPFYALAGTKLNDAVQSPCTPVPSDVVVTVDSVKAIPMPVQEISLLHTELNVVPEVFDSFVRPLLQTPPGKFETVADPPAGSNAPASEQFTRIHTGHVNPGETKEVVIHIDPGVTVANFAMYDTTRSLTLTVRGASGKEIQLDAEKNGIIRVDDPSTMIYLGYGFKQPKPGKWVITVKTTATTPSQGADYAIAAQFNGGAVLSAKTSSLIPKLNEPVTIQAELTDAGAALPLLSAQARLTKPDGSIETLDMNIQGNTASLTIEADRSGLYGIEVSVNSKTADGFEIDRAASLAFEVQPSEQAVTIQHYLLAAGIALLLLWMGRGVIRRWKKRRQVA